MKVLVFAKQIPDVNQVKFDPQTNRIVRENVPLSMNSFDRKAVEEAVRMKEKLGWETAVATMGPPQAKEILNDSLRMGIDEAYLVTDRNFAGSDTLATAKILSALVMKVKPDLVLTGKYSLDGETAQVPPEIAVFSGFAFKSSVSRIEPGEKEGTLKVEQENESGSETYTIPLPAVLSVSEKINRARAVKPDVPDKTDLIRELNAETLGIPFKGNEYSPTVVTGTSSLESTRKVRMLPFDHNVYQEIYEIIKSHRVKEQQAEKIDLKEPAENAAAILGIMLDEPMLGEEISTKISQLANEHSLKAVLFGNLDPSSARLAGHEYYFYNTESVEAFTDALTDFIKEKKPKYVVFPSTIKGREAAGTIAARLETGLTADCVDLEIKESRLIQYKPAFGGGIIAEIYSKTEPQMTTVRPGIFPRAVPVNVPKVFDLEYSPGRIYEKHEETPVPSEYAPLGSKEVVIGFGRGVKKKDQVGDILKLASLLDASVGATRPLVDMNFIPRQQQIGLTGISISPGVYLALGISGQANHVVGIRYAGKIISVNNDENAPIFQYSDYGIVADMHEFVEGLVKYLEGDMDH